MTETTILPADVTASVAPPVPRQGRRGLALALLILFMLLVALAGLCAYRWLVVLPQTRIQTFTAQGEQMKLLDQRLRALEDRPDQPPAATTVAANDDMARMQTEVSSLSASIATLQGQMHKAQMADAALRGMLASAIGFIRLDAAARSGRAFTTELATVRTALAQQPDPGANMTEILAALDGIAATGAPSLPQLQQQWELLSPRVATAVDRAMAQSWREKIIAALRSIISVRSVNDPLPAQVADVGMALAHGSAADALIALDKLPPASAAVTGDFRRQLETRRTTDTALAVLSTRFEAGMTPAKESAP